MLSCTVLQFIYIFAFQKQFLQHTIACMLVNEFVHFNTIYFQGF